MFDMRGVGVSVNRQPVGETATITTSGNLAIQQYAEIYPRVIARAVARRALKKGIVYGAKEGMHVGQRFAGEPADGPRRHRLGGRPSRPIPAAGDCSPTGFK